MYKKKSAWMGGGLLDRQRKKGIFTRNKSNSNADAFWPGRNQSHRTVPKDKNTH